MIARHKRVFCIVSAVLIAFSSFSTLSRGQADEPLDYMEAMGIISFKDRIKAPAFALENLEGKEVKLEDLKGKIVFLNFWATWCPPCRAEMPSMEKLYAEFKGSDFVMLAIDLREDAQTVEDFKKEFNLSFPILLDRNGMVGLTYGVRAIPTTYLVDQEGFLIGGALGPRDWSSKEAFGLIGQLIKKSSTS